MPVGSGQWAGSSVGRGPMWARARGGKGWEGMETVERGGKVWKGVGTGGKGWKGVARGGKKWIGVGRCGKG